MTAPILRHQLQLYNVNPNNVYRWGTQYLYLFYIIIYKYYKHQWEPYNKQMLV